MIACADGSFPAVRQSAWLRTAILYIPLISVTLLGKFAFTIGASELLIALPITLGVTGAGFISGLLKLNVHRTTLYLTVVGLFTALQAFAVDSFSLASLLLLFTTYFPYVFELTQPLEDPRRHMRRFLDFALFIALAGLAQYGLQFAAGSKYAFPIENLFPQSIVTHTYNTLNPLHYGSTIYKANGLFLAEAANFSQLLALAFTVECVMFRRTVRLLTYLAGMTVAFSGTGIMILMATIPALIVIYRRIDILMLMLAAGVLAFCLADILDLDIFVKRAEEFQRPGSSGFARFTGGFYFFDQFLSHDPKSWLFGLGSGVLHEAGYGAAHLVFPLPAYPVSASSAWIKIVAEYGLLGCLTFFGFIFSSMIRSQTLVLLRVGMCILPALIGLTDPWCVGLTLTLLLWSPASQDQLLTVPERERAAPKPDRRSALVMDGRGIGTADMPAAP